MPIKYLNRSNPTAISAGNSVLFNGSSQYLTAANNSALQLNTGNFTIEGWIYATAFQGSSDGNDLATVCDKDGIQGSTYSSYSIRCTNSGGVIKLKADCNTSSGGGSTGAVTSTATINTGTWYHFAYVRNGATAYLYINGTQEASAGIVDFYTTTNAFYIGYQNNAVSRFYWPGYISNFRVVKGTAVYTSSFTPSTAPLTAIANTSLLACQSATIVDNSSNNFTITNNGSATVSAVVPFTASLAPKGIAYKNRNNSGTPTPTGKSVLFNGSNYLTLTPNSSLAFGTNNFTVEMWIYPTSISAGADTILIEMRSSNNGKPVYAIHLQSALGFDMANLSYFSTSTGVITTNSWQHIAYVRNSGTTTIYVNGVSKGSTSDTGTYTYDVFKIGSGLDNSYIGYISNLRIVNGTAVYTSSFTPPTAPLTAIANTSLLTCNAATIVDGSTNNFTITNNGTATVSSTAPFTGSLVKTTMNFKKVYADPIVVYLTQKAIFGYGTTGTVTAVTNLVSNTGVVATDTTGVGTARQYPAAAGYGADKAIFGYGYSNAFVSLTNLVSNTGIVATDTTGVGTARNALAAAGYGSDKAIFGYGYIGSDPGGSMTNLVSNTGIVATDTAGVGTARRGLAAAGYGSDKAIFGYGYNGTNVLSMTNLVSNTGVVATDTAGVGTQRNSLAAAGYGTDKAIFGYGGPSTVSTTNLVSNTGVVATDTTGVGTARRYLAAAGYGTDKAVFGYGENGSANVSMTNLVSNTGVVATDTAGVGTARQYLAAAGYSLT